MQFATMNFGTAGKKSDFCFACNNFLGWYSTVIFNSIKIVIPLYPLTIYNDNIVGGLFTNNNLYHVYFMININTYTGTCTCKTSKSTH
jgi:hypothetical protein